MEYCNGVFVPKCESKRKIELFTSFKDVSPLLLDINTLCFYSSQKILKDLISVVKGEFLFEYEWAGMRTSFESDKEITLIEDMTSYEPDIRLKTSEFVQLFKERVAFMESFKNEEHLLRDTQNACKQILNNPKSFLCQDGFYRVIQDSIKFVFYLHPNDFKLNEHEIMSSFEVLERFVHYSD